MLIAVEAIWEKDEDGQDYRLVAPPGSEVTEADLKRLGLKANDKRVENVASEKLDAWYVKHGFVAAEQLPPSE